MRTDSGKKSAVYNVHACCIWLLRFVWGKLCTSCVSYVSLNLAFPSLYVRVMSCPSFKEIIESKTRASFLVQCAKIGFVIV